MMVLPILVIYKEDIITQSADRNRPDMEAPMTTTMRLKEGIRLHHKMLTERTDPAHDFSRNRTLSPSVAGLVR